MSPGKKPYKPPQSFVRQYTKLQRAFAESVARFKQIENNDRILVAMSGGKDSYTLLHLLVDFERRSPLCFQIFPVIVSTGFGNFLEDTKKVAEFVLANYDLTLAVVQEEFQDIIATYKTDGTSSCSFCARLRRGTLQTYCIAENINKIALGHHADDVIESFLMSELQNGRLWTQAPNYLSNKNIHVIRPLFLIYESEIAEFRDLMQFPTINCSCEHEGDPKHFRAVSKRTLAELVDISPNCKSSLLKCCIECVESLMRQDEQETSKLDQL